MFLKDVLRLFSYLNNHLVRAERAFHLKKKYYRGCICPSTVINLTTLSGNYGSCHYLLRHTTLNFVIHFKIYIQALQLVQ